MTGWMAPFPDEPWLLTQFRDVKPNWREDDWRCCFNGMDGSVHVLPANDIVMCHEFNVDCPCGPTERLLEDPPLEMPDVWMYIHHALDGRP